MSMIRNIIAPMTSPRVAAVDKHVVWLPQARLAYFRVPKAANSSIRYLLAQRFGLEPSGPLRPNKDRFWSTQRRNIARTLDPESFLANPRARGAWSFSFVRHPAARLFSCWNNKVIENGTLSPRLQGMGAQRGMSFADFAALTAETDDTTCDIHLRSQVSILTLEGRVLPNFIGRMESLAQDWDHVTYEVELRSGIALGPLLEKNVRARITPSIVDQFSSATRKHILRRYRKDFDLFYPGAIAAMEEPDIPAAGAPRTCDSKESPRREGSSGR